MRNINDINKDIENCRNRLHNLCAERDEYRRTKINPLLYNPFKIYKFRFPVYEDEWGEEEFVGIIKNIWFSETEGAYEVEFCGLVSNLIHDSQEFSDCQWGIFDAAIQREVREDQIKRFIGNLQEMSYEEFKEYYDNTFLSNMADRVKYWFDYYMTFDKKDNENGND